jgi:exonuclease VII large subunit
MSWRAKSDQAVPEEAPAPTSGDGVLAQRLAELTHREVALRRITEVVEKQRTRLEERERALESSAAAAVAADDERLAEAMRRAEQFEQRVRELEQQVSELQARPAPQAPEPAIEAPPDPEPEPEPPPRAHVVDLDATESTYTLQRLERLVHDAQLRGDPQAEEWSYYLPLLREHAEPDGRLPAQFASLVDSIFAA